MSLDALAKDMKDIKNRKDSTEIGIVTALKPHFKFTINGKEYSSEFFTVYLPAVDRIKQYEKIEVETVDPNPGIKRINDGEAYVDIGDLELEPDRYERRFLVGDLIDVTDRGDSFIVHGRLMKIGEDKELYGQTHRDPKGTVQVNRYDRINKPPVG